MKPIVGPKSGIRRRGLGAGCIVAVVLAAAPAQGEDATERLLNKITDFLSRPSESIVPVPMRRNHQTAEDPLADEPPPAAVTRRAARATHAAVPESAPQPARPAAELPPPTELPGRLDNVDQSHILQAVQNLIAEIGILRDELAIYNFPVEAAFVENCAPIHVYAKSLEILGKVADVQWRLRLPAAKVRQMPLIETDEGDVLLLVEFILQQVRRIKGQMGIKREIESAPLADDGTCSMSYAGLVDASFLLDGLRGQPMTPNDVYRNALFVLDELAPIAERLGVSLAYRLPPVETPMTPADVAAQITHAMGELIHLQTRLQMDWSGVPTRTPADATPSRNFDATNVLLAELVRIKLHLGIAVPRIERRSLPSGRQPNDAFALMSLIVRNLNALAVAASS